MLDDFLEIELFLLKVMMMFFLSSLVELSDTSLIQLLLFDTVTGELSELPNQNIVYTSCHLPVSFII